MYKDPLLQTFRSALVNFCIRDAHCGNMKLCTRLIVSPNLLLFANCVDVPLLRALTIIVINRKRGINKTRTGSCFIFFCIKYFNYFINCHFVTFALSNNQRQDSKSFPDFTINYIILSFLFRCMFSPCTLS